MIKIALALIVKGSAEEAKCLEDLLDNSAKHVDGIFITSTYRKGEQPNKEVGAVAKKYKANLSTFEWCFDFAKARNFNFAQVPQEYTHILWCDADDNFRGLEKLRASIETYPHIDTLSMNYMYFFDEYKQPTVVHVKTQVIKNNGCVEWVGALHEDFHPLREIDMKFLIGIERMHMTTEKRMDENKIRNVEISERALASNPDDPRLYWNYGNSLFGAAQYAKAKEVFLKFIELSTSDEEKYLVHTKLASVAAAVGDKAGSVNECQVAIGMKPLYPDAYHLLGQIYYNQGNYNKAVEMITQGLIKKPPYYSIIVYNPREYDFIPMMLLAKCFFQLARPDQAVTCLEACKKMQPKNKAVLGMLKVIKDQSKVFEKAVVTIQKLSKITDDVKFAKAIGKLPHDMQSHPGICALKNTRLIKKESSGKDLVYYCGFTELEWSPEYAKTKGVGGSEEAVLNLSKEWAKAGWNVTVYNNCGHEEQVADGVTYKPFWSWNYRDKQDVVILWRSPKAVDYGINADKIFVDLHDVIPAGEFTMERVAKINKIFVKTNFHKSLFPNVPDEKFAVIPNGMDFELFSQDVKKDQYLMVNTSSPDRSMDVLPKLFKEVKKHVPQARCKWAYGFDVFDKVHCDNAPMMKWKEDTLKAMEEAGIENMGRLTQKDCAKLYLEANILAYPTEFAEIDCITVKKAQACGAIPVTTDFGALEESVQFGMKIHSKKTKDDWCKPFQFHFGIDGEKEQKEWVDAVVEQLKKPIGDRSEMKEWSKKFSWGLISSKWIDIMK